MNPTKLPKPGVGTFKIPLFGIQDRYRDFFEDVCNDLEDVLFLGDFVGGVFLDQFEKAFAAYHQMDYCVGVGSGTDALILSLKALGIGHGDEVIVPAMTFMATPMAVTHVGAAVKFVDVDPITYTIDPEELEQAIGLRTRAVIIVHLYGQPCNMNEIMEIVNCNNKILIEDCAQATGAEWKGQKVGSFGYCSCFSFYPTKPLGGIAQGGAVLSNDLDFITEVRSLSNMGRTPGSHVEISRLGFNSRLDTINAHFLKRCLPRLDGWGETRRKIAGFYKSCINSSKLSLPFEYEHSKHAYHLFMVRAEDKYLRKELLDYLDKHLISTGLYYPIPCHKQPLYNFGYFPNTERLSETLFALPMDTFLTTKQLDYICTKINKFFDGV